MTRAVTNVAASVRARLLNISSATGEEFQRILERYALERFLYRLSVSDHRDAFILKGAMLLAACRRWVHGPRSCPFQRRK